MCGGAKQVFGHTRQTIGQAGEGEVVGYLEQALSEQEYIYLREEA